MSSKTDATKNILGFKYQEMVALSKCFEAKDNTKIYLECYGDISNGIESIEVKHSVNDNKLLNDSHIDFWKTLSNILDEHDKFRFYNSFILHTTARIKKDSIFNDWGNTDSKTRLKNILEVTPNQTIKKYYSNIEKFNSNDLKDILEKFIIEDNQKSAKEYYKDVLIEHPSIINSLDKDNREPFLISLLGYISKALINTQDYIWTIDINDFRENFRSYENAYKIEELQFPISKIEVDTKLRKTFRFIKELKAIDYDGQIGGAMNDYLRASESQIEMIKSRNSLSKILDDYDDDLKEQIDFLKISYDDKLTYKTSPDLNQESKRFYDESISICSSKTNIQNILGVLTYYPRGRLHHSIEEDIKFKWRLK